MKRFYLFAGYNFCPGGGLGDYRGAFDTKEDAMGFCSIQSEPYPAMIVPGTNYDDEVDWASVIEATDSGLVERCHWSHDKTGRPAWKDSPCSST